MSAPAALADAIDLERYPIDDLDGPAAGTLLARCREQLGRLGACELEGFLRADAVTDAVRSVEGLQPLAFRTETTHNLEFSGREADLDPDDPLRIQVRSAKSLLAYDQAPGDSPLRAVYESDVLTRFVGAALQVEPIYVTPISGSIPRINAVLSYASKPDAMLSAAARRIFFGRE